MIDEIRQRTAIIFGLCEVFGRQLSKEALGVYVGALSDLSLPQIREAAGRAARECEFFPAPAVLRKLTGAKSVDQRAILAWAEAWDAVSLHGSYRTVAFANPRTFNTVLAMGGWPKFCLPDREEQWHRKEFLDVYAAVDNSFPDGSRGIAPGLMEMRGMDPKEIPLIGGELGREMLELETAAESSVGITSLKSLVTELKKRGAQ